MSANFRQKAASSTNHCWCQKTRMISLPRNIKISSALFGFVTKQACDRQTDKRTVTDRQMGVQTDNS